MKKPVVLGMICALLGNLTPVYSSPLTPLLTPETTLLANMLVLKGSDLPQAEVNVRVEQALTDYASTASSDSDTRNENLAQALVSMNITSSIDADILRGELKDAGSALQSASDAQKNEVLQGKLVEMLQTTSGAQFSGCKITSAVFSNLEGIAATAFVYSIFQVMPNMHTGDTWDFALAGSFVVFVASVGITHFTCNGPN